MVAQNVLRTFDGKHVFLVINSNLRLLSNQTNYWITLKDRFHSTRTHLFLSYNLIYVPWSYPEIAKRFSLQRTKTRFLY